MTDIKSMKDIECLQCKFVNHQRARICERCQQSLIVDNYGLTDVYKTFDELIDPLADALRKHSDDNVRAEDLLSFEVYSVAISLANSQRGISGNEARVIREIRYNLNHDVSVNVDIPTFRDHLRDQVRQQSILNVFDRKISCVSLLLLHDHLYGTDYGPKIKGMFLRFANIVLKSDATVTTIEYDALRRFTDHLDSHDYGLPVASESVDSQAAQIHTPAIKESDSLPLEDLLSELNSLVGLERVKNEVKELVNFLKVQQLRQAKKDKGNSCFSASCVLW